jgi:TATA-box binding protein (TBP) (component of TFIID and TFIIIB)
MSGCKNVRSINIAINKLITRLSETKAIIQDDVLVECPFFEKSINSDNFIVTNFKIDMINSNYHIPIHIDRKKLYDLLSLKKTRCAYEPCIRACVIVKFIPPLNNPCSKDISIFIFQKGNIIITGAQNKIHLLSAYEYINDILNNHKDDIVKINESNEEKIIFNLYNQIIKDINIGLIKL